MIQRNVISGFQATLTEKENYAEFIEGIEKKLDEADVVAEESEYRLSHDEVFLGLRRRVNG